MAWEEWRHGEDQKEGFQMSNMKDWLFYGMVWIAIGGMFFLIVKCTLRLTRCEKLVRAAYENTIAIGDKLGMKKYKVE